MMDAEYCSPDYPVARCVTCGEPLRYRDTREWSFLNLKKNVAEHDDCYRIRFALQYPDAKKAKEPQP
jgi:hypothetical protein